MNDITTDSSGNSFDKIFGSTRYELKNMRVESDAWFLQKIKELRKPMKNRFNSSGQRVIFNLAREEPAKSEKRFGVGKMYLFQYDPKYRETLPVWDKFPLVLPFRKVKGGFFAINIHYLPYKARAWLLNELAKGAREGRKGVAMNYGTLLKFSNLKNFEYSIHHYLDDHMLSRPVFIPVYDWGRAMLLPVAKFHGKDATKFTALNQGK